MVIVGLSPIAHESAVGIIVNGKLVAAASEERFSRVKNQAGFPHKALEYILQKAGMRSQDVDHVAYAALPILEERRRDVAAYAANVAYVIGAKDAASHKLRHLANYGRNVLFKSEWLPFNAGQHKIEEALKAHGLGGKLVYVDHHRGHCASAYYTSGFDRCLAVSLDGYGSGQAGSFYLCEGGRMKCLAPIPYPHSLGTFYRRVTQALGFKPNRHEGKIVGLAAFGDPSVLEEEIFQRFDFSHEDYFRFKSGQDPYFERTLVASYSREDIAAAYQRVLERVAVEYVTRWVKRTGVKQVACAGGVFANVKMNQRILEIPEVEEIFIFPAMGDSGVGVGAALALQADLSGLLPTRLDNVYLGPAYSEAEIEKAIVASSLKYHRPPCIEAEMAQHLVNNRVVARFDGAMEFGPRSLGNRSILYPATEPSVNKWLNERLNRTEFMPFAPITLAEHADSLYQNISGARYAAEFMTITADCTELMKQQSPAAVHVDGTARPQLLRQEINPSLYDVLTRYHTLSGIPTLINTSYNMHEEPIVCSPEDALRAFQDGRLEVLALGPFILESAA